MAFIKGNFKKYIFKSDKGYTVGLFKIKDTSSDLESYKGKTITFTGYFDDLNESDIYILNGNFVEHERYGEQFSTSSYEITLPNDKDNVIDFLSSNLFPGIGEKKAEQIVKVLGSNCLEVILNNPDNLYLVPKITKKQKETIEVNLNKYEQSYKTIVELNKCGFSTKDSLLINSKYKEKSLDVVNENIYTLVDDIRELSFKKIDSLRSNFNITDVDIRRIEQGIKYVLEEVSYTLGNTYFSINEIVGYTKRALFIFDEEKIYEGINNLTIKDEIIKVEDKYFYYKMYEAENYIAKRIFNLANNMSLGFVNDKDIKKLEEYYDISYNDDQKHAIKEALSNNFLVITGGPGTGKTTIIKAICRLYQDLNGFDTNALMENLALLAPTGRAAKRIAEQTLLKASTIHRFLKWNKEDDTFNVNEYNKSNVRFVIIDEASMIDTYLLYNLLLGLKENTKIILIGDYNQLPSVGPGQILKDIVESDLVNIIKLNKLYRQEETSNINLLAYNINNGNFSFDLFNTSDDLIFKESSSDKLKDYLKEYILKYKDMSFNDFITLAPIYKQENGIDDLNNFMQEILNPKSFNKNEIIIDGVLYRENDKVIELVNMVDDNVFNGDIGKILRIKNTSPKEVLIDFDSNIVKFTPTTFNNFSLGYTISIHKSQGSEFDTVIIPVLNKYSNMLYKKLIYTATTRAKKKLILVGE
ncbi:MAG: ATP-dependent RecD-like DNA helicase, partial [bacterium]|nr:ATP-dependent RecD-like DNA helicase [bacterium]